MSDNHGYTDGLLPRIGFYDQPQEFIRFLCVAGFTPPEELLGEVLYTLKACVEEVPDEQKMAELVSAEIAAKQQIEKTFPDETDCERLTRAFEALTARGIVAIENAGQTPDAGWEELNEIAADWEEKGAIASLRGACFYHEQDLQEAISDGTLNLRYGDLHGREELSLAIGAEIVEVLGQHGLVATWSGSCDECPEVALTGRRRSAPRASVEPPEELCTFEEAEVPEGPELTLGIRVESLVAARALVLEGSLAAETCEQLVASALAIPGDLVIELDGLESFEEEGTSALMSLRRQLDERGNKLAVVSTNPNLCKIFRITGMAKVLNLCDTREQAATKLAQTS